MTTNKLIGQNKTLPIDRQIDDIYRNLSFIHQDLKDLSYDYGHGVLRVVSGLVGINTKSPRAQLDNNGKAIIRDTLTVKTIDNETTDVDKFLVDSSSIIKYRTGDQVLSDIGASSSSHLHDGDTIECDGIDSDGGAFAFDTTGTLTFGNTIALSTCVDAGVDTDKFLVLDASNNVDYRTGAEVASDIQSSIDHGSIAGLTDDDHVQYMLDAGTSVDNTIPRFDGTDGRTMQTSGIVVDDSNNVSSMGTLGCNEITIADGHGLNLQEDITFLGATTENQIKFPDALANALSFQEGANLYQTFKTTNGSEAVVFGKNVTIPDGAAATPSLNFSSATNTGLYYDSVKWNFNFSVGGAAVFGVSAAAANSYVDFYFNDSIKILLGNGSDGEIYVDTDNLYIKNVTSNYDLIFGINDGGVSKTITWDADVDQLKHSHGLFDFHDDNLLTTGTLGCGEITVADGSGINLQEDITFLGATTENQIKFPDALADALSFKEGSNSYLTFVTTDGSEGVAFQTGKVAIGSLNFDNKFLVYGSALGSKFKRVDNYTGATKTVLNLVAEDTGNLIDGDGVALSFRIEDAGSGGENTIGYFNVVRDGADNSGKISLITNSGGVATGDFSLYATGAAINSGSFQCTCLGINIAPTANRFVYINDAAITTTDRITGIDITFTKTAGVTDVSDPIYGMYFQPEINHNGGVHGYFIGLRGQALLTAGDVGSAGTPLAAAGYWGGIDLDGGKIYGTAHGAYFIVDQEAANEVTSNLYGCRIYVDADGTVGGSVILCSLEEGSNVDYAIYHTGTHPSIFGGHIKIQADKYLYLGAANDAAIGYNGTDMLFYANLVGSGVFRFKDASIFIETIKSGATQAAAGAVANEVWKTSGHATLPDNVLMIGV